MHHLCPNLAFDAASQSRKPSSYIQSRKKTIHTTKSRSCSSLLLGGWHSKPMSSLYGLPDSQPPSMGEEAYCASFLSLVPHLNCLCVQVRQVYPVKALLKRLETEATSSLPSSSSFPSSLRTPPPSLGHSQTGTLADGRSACHLAKTLTTPSPPALTTSLPS